jgi:hypothetical protein
MAGQFFLEEPPRSARRDLPRQEQRPARPAASSGAGTSSPSSRPDQGRGPDPPRTTSRRTQAPEDRLDFVDSPRGGRVCYDDDCEPGEPPCPCDINGDGILDLADIGGFIGCFTGMLPCGDLNSDGIWDLADIGLFISCFTAGCP